MIKKTKQNSARMWFKNYFAWVQFKAIIFHCEQSNYIDWMLTITGWLNSKSPISNTEQQVLGMEPTTFRCYGSHHHEATEPGTPSYHKHGLTLRHKTKSTVGLLKTMNEWMNECKNDWEEEGSQAKLLNSTYGIKDHSGFRQTDIQKESFYQIFPKTHSQWYSLLQTQTPKTVPWI